LQPFFFARQSELDTRTENVHPITRDVMEKIARERLERVARIYAS